MAATKTASKGKKEKRVAKDNRLAPIGEYGGRNGTGVASGGKNKFGVKVEFEQGSGPRGRYNVKTKSGVLPISRFLRVLGACKFTWQMADHFLADSGMPGLSLNTMKSQVNSGYRGTLTPKEQKSSSIDGKGTNATHHGIADAEDIETVGKKLLADAHKYYAAKVATMRAAGNRPS